MIHEILRVGMLQCNCSILGDEASGEAIVIDPGDDVAAIEEVLSRHRLRVKAIFITHGHIDHVGGVHALKARSGAPVYMNANDSDLYDSLAVQASWLGMETPAQAPIDVTVRDGDKLTLGAATLHVLDTPGHSPGSVCLWIPAENKLISGDTLFRESIGRTDLPGGDGTQILRSIRRQLFVLPEQAVVIPGHGSTTTIGHEKIFNPFAGSRT